MTRRIYFLKVFIAVLVLLVPEPSFGQPGGGGKPMAVIVAKAKKVPFADRVEALGTLRANESVDLTATVTERVTFLGFEDGVRVQKGQVLVKLSSTEEEAQLTEAVATTNEARLQYDRATQLAQRGASSVSALDESRRNFETASARQGAIESVLANLVVKAPFDGIVGLRNISVGALVRPGDLITTVDDDSTMLLDFSIPSSFLPVIAIGQEIEAKTAGFGSKTFRGNVRSLSSRIDPVTRTVIVRAELPNPERLLKPGLLMTVEFFSNPRDTVLVPEGALLPSGRRSFVMVAAPSPTDPSKLFAERREVTTGSRRQGEVEITGGLEAGEQVVTHGGFKLAEGTALNVTLKKDEPDTEQVAPVPASLN
ncbi:MAG: efflux RND transporter periplasmic adaptor subunit [Terrimicrobiaceae bacterium]